MAIPGVDELYRFRLDERVAIVAGGTGGIGSRLCEALARVGARVVVHGRDRARAEAVAERLREPGSDRSPEPAPDRPRDEGSRVDATVV